MESQHSPIHLGSVAGDLRIARWEGDGTSLARLMDDDGQVIPLDGADPRLHHMEGDATLLVGGAAEVRVAHVGGDVTASQIGGALHVEAIGSDAVVDGVAGAVVLGHVGGELTAVRLGDDLTVLAVGGDVAIDGVRGAVRLASVGGDMNLRGGTGVEVTSVHGDLRCQGATSVAVSGTVGGDVTLAQVDRCAVQHVGGDVTALDVRGDLALPNVAGDVRLRRIEGQVRLAGVGGDLAAQDVLGGIMADVRGEAYLETPLTAGATYHMTAESIVLRARSPISAQFVATSTGGEVRTHLPLTVERHRQHLVGVIGAGEATVTLTATSGDILLDAAGASDETRAGRHGRDTSDAGTFRVHIDAGAGGPHINIDGDGIASLIGREFATQWPFRGGFSMSDDTNTPRDYADMQQQIQDFSDRASRAARKAAERMRDYTDRAAQRARETDWEAVRRDVRNAIERTVGELDSFFREITAEFDRPTVEGTTTTPKASSPTAQRIPIERDDVPAAAQTAPTPDAPADRSVPTPADDRAAQRRAILEQLRSGDLSLEDAEARLKDL